MSWWSCEEIGEMKQWRKAVKWNDGDLFPPSCSRRSLNFSEGEFRLEFCFYHNLKNKRGKKHLIFEQFSSTWWNTFYLKSIGFEVEMNQSNLICLIESYTTAATWFGPIRKGRLSAWLEMSKVALIKLSFHLKTTLRGTERGEGRCEIIFLLSKLFSFSCFCYQEKRFHCNCLPWNVHQHCFSSRL